ncbi:MAG: hypothetical protein C0472_08585, partial [Erythrobacter sp.]|nr:hypothetical protein [Erythrobacter sp.]
MSRNPAFDPTRLRAEDVAGLTRASRNRVIANAMLAAFVVSIFAPLIGLAVVLPWAGMLTAILLRTRQTDMLLVESGARMGAASLERAQNINAIAGAACWLAALLLFPWLSDGAQATAMLLVILALISASTFVFSTSPLSVLIYIAVLGAGTIVAQALAGEWHAMGGAILFTIANLVAMIEIRTTFVKARLAEAAVAEKEAVVSLLLREFEENEADWLWEVDP